MDQKHTMTGTIIPSDSCHPSEHNYAAIHYVANRMNTYHLNKSNKVYEGQHGFREGYCVDWFD